MGHVLVMCRGQEDFKLAECVAYGTTSVALYIGKTGLLYKYKLFYQ
jgi:hypothetical protein